MNLKGVKLTTGLDIVGKVKEETAEYIIMEEAVIVSIVQTKQGMAASLNPLDMFSDQADSSMGSTVQIYWSAALFPYTPHPALAQRYTEQLTGLDLSAAGTGIITP